MNKMFAESLAISTAFLSIALLLYTAFDCAPPSRVYEFEDGYFTLFSVTPSFGVDETKCFKVGGRNWFIQCDVSAYTQYSNIIVSLFKEGSDEPLLTLGFSPKMGVLERLSGVQSQPTKSNLWLLFIRNLFQPDLPPGAYYLRIQWKEIKWKITVLEA